MKSSDLPSTVKQEFLERLREQVGWDRYHQLVSDLGENGIFDRVLDHAEQASAAANAEIQEKRKNRLYLTSWLSLIGLVWLAGCIWNGVGTGNLSAEIVFFAGGMLWSLVNKEWLLFIILVDLALGLKGYLFTTVFYIVNGIALLVAFMEWLGDFFSKLTRF